MGRLLDSRAAWVLLLALVVGLSAGEMTRQRWMDGAADDVLVGAPQDLRFYLSRYDRQTGSQCTILRATFNDASVRIVAKDGTITERRIQRDGAGEPWRWVEPVR